MIVHFRVSECERLIFKHVCVNECMGVRVYVVMSDSVQRDRCSKWLFITTADVRDTQLQNDQIKVDKIFEIAKNICLVVFLMTLKFSLDKIQKVIG